MPVPLSWPKVKGSPQNTSSSLHLWTVAILLPHAFPGDVSGCPQAWGLSQTHRGAVALPSFGAGPLLDP